MANKAPRRRFGFLKFEIAYILLFLVVLLCAMRLGWTFLAEYEASRPSNALDDYIASIDEAHIRELSEDFIATLDPVIQDPEAAQQQILDLFNGRLTYARISSESTDEVTVYAISCKGKKLGKIQVKNLPQESQFSFERREVTGESYEFSYLVCEPQSITVPEEMSVECNGAKLDASYITERGVRYNMLDDFSDYMNLFELPEMVTYTVSNYVGDVNFRVITAKGEEIQQDQISAESLTTNCSAEEIERVNALAKDFTYANVKYSGNADKAVYANLEAVVKLCAPDSKLITRFREAKDALVYAHSLGDTVRTLETTDHINLGNGYYYCVCTYIVDQKTIHGPVATNNRVQLIVKDVPDVGMRAFAMMVDNASVIEE